MTFVDKNFNKYLFRYKIMSNYIQIYKENPYLFFQILSLRRQWTFKITNFDKEKKKKPEN